MGVQKTMTNQILHCDCVEGMARLPAVCIPLTVTSPPYDALRDYGGHQFNFEAVAHELYRITTPGGVLVWVVQNQVVDGGESAASFRQCCEIARERVRLARETLDNEGFVIRTFE
jgi:site-specific DNA-methyltransferase (adenine-specific)